MDRRMRGVGRSRRRDGPRTPRCATTRRRIQVRPASGGRRRAGDRSPGDPDDAAPDVRRVRSATVPQSRRWICRGRQRGWPCVGDYAEEERRAACRWTSTGPDCGSMSTGRHSCRTARRCPNDPLSCCCTVGPADTTTPTSSPTSRRRRCPRRWSTSTSETTVAQPGTTRTTGPSNSAPTTCAPSATPSESPGRSSTATRWADSSPCSTPHGIQIMPGPWYSNRPAPASTWTAWSRVQARRRRRRCGACPARLRRRLGLGRGVGEGLRRLRSSCP